HAASTCQTPSRLSSADPLGAGTAPCPDGQARSPPHSFSLLLSPDQWDKFPPQSPNPPPVRVRLSEHIARLAHAPCVDRYLPALDAHSPEPREKNQPL